MSVIGKKPLVNVLLEDLSKENLALLKANLDANVVVKYNNFVDLYKNGVLGQVYVPTFNAIFVKPYLLNFEPDEQHLVPYLLHSDGKLNKLDEKITILELRSELNDRLIEAGAIVPENVKFTVSNIKALTDTECNDLKVGDMVAKKTGNQYHVYVVTYKEPGQGMCLTYTDASVVETQSYDYTAGHWVYNSEDKTDFADLGGGLPDVTSADNEKVLEVIAGAWGKGRKKVNVYDVSVFNAFTPAEKIDIAEKGCFINGTYLGYKNPQLYPSTVEQYGFKFGWLIGSKNLDVYLTQYQIYNDEITTADNRVLIKLEGYNNRININNVFSLNGKQIPSYPTSSAVGHFICRKGALEYYIPVAQSGVTSGDTIATTSDLGKALIDHLDVEINGYRARYQYTDGNYVVYSSMSEADSGVNLQVNMISYNTTNGELSFNQMKFAPVS